MNSYHEVHGISINYRIIGNNIRKLRKAKSLRQEDLADKLGISSTHYSNCERGTRTISLELILSICHILDVSLEVIIANAIFGIPFTNQNDNSILFPFDGKEEAWLKAMRAIQVGCTDQARTYMFDACRNLAELDHMHR